MNCFIYMYVLPTIVIVCPSKSLTIPIAGFFVSVLIPKRNIAITILLVTNLLICIRINKLGKFLANLLTESGLFAKKERKFWSGRKLSRFGSGLIAFLAFEFDANLGLASLLGDDPGTIHPRGIVANVLRVTTSKIGHPVTLFVLVVIDYFLFHKHNPVLESHLINFTTRA